MREESLRQGNQGKEATEFYKNHREEMDAGSQVAWPQRYNEDEISAIQHAKNLEYDMGIEAFNAEFQNDPAAGQVAVDMLLPRQVAERFNGRNRGEVPLGCSKLTGFVDVHKELLFWCVCAWQDDFTGFVIDYGTFPEQKLSYFTLANAPKTLSRIFPRAGEDGAIQAGLEKLVSKLLECEWRRSGGGVVRIDRLLVDMGYKSTLVSNVKHICGGSAMMLSKGVGIRAGNKPISMYQRRPGWTIGHHWYIPNVSGTREHRHICIDVNFWKSLVHSNLAVPPGDPGALTLFSKSADEHGLFSEHVAGSETWTLTFGQGRDLREWRIKPNRPDNHWFDCLVGCATGANLLGAATPGMTVTRAKKERIRLSDLQRESKNKSYAYIR